MNDNYINYNYNEPGCRLNTLYTDTALNFPSRLSEPPLLTSDQLYARLQYTEPRPQPATLPVFIKDTTKPFSYYTMKSYAYANSSNYYVNFDNPEYNVNEMNQQHLEHQEHPSFENSGCVKTCLCGLFGSLICCFYTCKPF